MIFQVEIALKIYGLILVSGISMMPNLSFENGQNGSAYLREKLKVTILFVKSVVAWRWITSEPPTLHSLGRAGCESVSY